MAAACISYQSGGVVCEAISKLLEPWSCRQRLLDLPEGHIRLPDAIKNGKALESVGPILLSHGPKD